MKAMGARENETRRQKFSTKALAFKTPSSKLTLQSYSITIASSRAMKNEERALPYIVGVEVGGFSQPIWDNRVDDQD